MSAVGHAPAAFPAPRRTRGRARRDPHDLYAALLCISLVGYATLGKGYAYLGVAPLFIGEVVLALGLVVLLRSRCSIATITTGPSLLLLAMLAWVTVRTLPYLGPYGFDAPRDSMIVAYGLFAFVVAALLVEKPERFGRVLAAYAGFASFYGWAGGLIYHVTNPGFLSFQSPVQLPMVRAGEAAVHLAGAATFMLLGLGRASRAWWLLLLVSIVLVVPSRAAMLTCLLPIGLAVVLGGKLMRFLPGAAASLVLLGAVYAAGLEVETPGGRSVGPVQMVDNVQSILGYSDASNLDGTKAWRLKWWDTIRGYTFGGPFFWTGKGFGVNLSKDDGFELEGGKATLRSPHNGHMTILARAGVPGLALWIGTAAAWFWVLGRSWLRARRLGSPTWAGIFVWLMCYASGILINASFDVALEGPMLGIWYWSIFGFGLGAVMIFEAEIRRRRPAGRRIAAAP